MKQKLTLLTDPISVGKYFWTENLRSVARAVRNRLKGRSNILNTSYRGHPAVTGSIVRGLEKIGMPYIYNPKKTADITDTVVVLSGIRTLRQAIELKKKGLIKKLIAGTNILLLPSENSELGGPEINMIITPSEWVCEVYIKECPKLKGRCLAWPAGVDTDYWLPQDKNYKNKKVLIFEKLDAGIIPDVNEYMHILKERGYQTTLLQRNNILSYESVEYRSILNECCLMLGFSRSESQGIAWTEAWSMDVPTFIWNNDENVIMGKTVKTSSAPYLSDKNGCFFNDVNDFKSVLVEWESGHKQFAPRQWVLDNMSDEVCAKRLCDLTDN